MCCQIRRINGGNVAISIFSLAIITSSLGIIATSNYSSTTIHFAYGLTSQMNPNNSNNTNTNSVDIQISHQKKFMLEM
jgi:hypothetical protein